MSMIRLPVLKRMVLRIRVIEPHYSRSTDADNGGSVTGTVWSSVPRSEATCCRFQALSGPRCRQQVDLVLHHNPLTPPFPSRARPRCPVHQNNSVGSVWNSRATMLPNSAKPCCAPNESLTGAPDSMSHTTGCPSSSRQNRSRLMTLFSTYPMKPSTRFSISEDGVVTFDERAAPR